MKIPLIHYRSEGEIIRTGLNIYRNPSYIGTKWMYHLHFWRFTIGLRRRANWLLEDSKIPKYIWYFYFRPLKIDKDGWEWHNRTLATHFDTMCVRVGNKVITFELLNDWISVYGADNKQISS